MCLPRPQWRGFFYPFVGPPHYDAWGPTNGFERCDCGAFQHVAQPLAAVDRPSPEVVGRADQRIHRALQRKIHDADGQYGRRIFRSRCSCTQFHLYSIHQSQSSLRMAIRAHYNTKFQLGECYHVYNSSVAKEPIFEKEFYCRYFLSVLKENVLPWIDLYAWCIMRNHFHLLFKVAPKWESKDDLSRARDWHQVVSHGVAITCQAFATHYNRANHRQGALFQNPFKRAHIDSEDYFTQAVYYIHNNPNRHHVMQNFEDYPWSSYSALISTSPTNLDRETVLNWFGGRDLFVEYHAKRPRIGDSMFWIE